MPGIFDDDCREIGAILLNPFRTKPIWPQNGVAKGVKWPALRRLSRLDNGQKGVAPSQHL